MRIKHQEPKVIVLPVERGRQLELPIPLAFTHKDRTNLAYRRPSAPISCQSA